MTSFMFLQFILPNNWHCAHYEWQIIGSNFDISVDAFRLQLIIINTAVLHPNLIDVVLMMRKNYLSIKNMIMKYL